MSRLERTAGVGHRPRQLASNTSRGAGEPETWYSQHLTSLVASAETARRNAIEAAADHQEEDREAPLPLTLGQKLDQLNADALVRATNPFAAPARSPHEEGLRKSIVDATGRTPSTDH
jgi:hypothetical protein